MSTTNDVMYHMGGVPVHGEFTTGNVFFVSSVTGSDGNTGKKPTQAFATLDKATNACTANKNDIVYIMPNHAETISGSTSWVPDVAGVRYIGIGLGADAPELTFSATGSTIDVTGGNSEFRNIRFVAGISAVVLGVDVGADHVTFDGCVWDFSTTAFDFITMLDVTAVDYCTIKNCRFIAENVTAGSNVGIQFEDSHHLLIQNNIFTGDFAVAAISSTDADVSNGVMILENSIYNDDTASTNGGIRMVAACTGMISKNMIGWLCKAAESEKAIDPGSCLMFENYVATVIDQYGSATLVGTAST